MHPQEVRTTTNTLCSSEKKNLISKAKSYYNLPKTAPVTGYASLDEYLFNECLLSDFHSSVLITLRHTASPLQKQVDMPSTLPHVPLHSLLLTSRIKNLFSGTSALIFTYLSGSGEPVPDDSELSLKAPVSYTV